MATIGDERERWCVVTGGRGFAARHLVEMLLRSPEWHVRIADLSPSINLESHEETGLLREALRSGRASYASVDLRLKRQVLKAFHGAEVVFHMAAPDSSINNFQLHFSVNVEGTKNVIDACIECKVKRLIYTSSPSVVFDGVHGIYNGEESMPYPLKFNDSYSETKAEAEKLVLKANGKNGLLTSCIRPSSIFGPGDRLLVPSLVAAARAGKSKLSSCMLMLVHAETRKPHAAYLSFAGFPLHASTIVSRASKKRNSNLLHDFHLSTNKVSIRVSYHLCIRAKHRFCVFFSISVFLANLIGQSNARVHHFAILPIGFLCAAIYFHGGPPRIRCLGDGDVRQTDDEAFDCPGGPHGPHRSRLFLYAATTNLLVLLSCGGTEPPPAIPSSVLL
ncbi:3beta-hydroxysteroid-dehydrogenase/decarboxylase isoform 1 [Platanthera guangdongensis]|uniref:3beta-hydroxysteroid-dehydrogenase/decarboxylase isoform 1 n=1 Tax=Platanthera guangdongensis TaxID=2320717 RepID=A0ABR2MJ58_9ASPA